MYSVDHRFILQDGVVIAKAYDLEGKYMAMKNAKKIAEALNQYDKVLAGLNDLKESMRIEEAEDGEKADIIKD